MVVSNSLNVQPPIGEDDLVDNFFGGVETHRHRINNESLL